MRFPIIFLFIYFCITLRSASLVECLRSPLGNHMQGLDKAKPRWARAAGCLGISASHQPLLWPEPR